MGGAEVPGGEAPRRAFEAERTAFMTRTISLVAMLLGMASLARPDMSESRMRDLASRLSTEGQAGRLAKELQTYTGRRALLDRLNLLLLGSISRVRQDAQGLYEDHLFSTDPDGRLVLRPEGRAELERLKRRIPLSMSRFEAFSKRLDEIGERIACEDDLERAATAGWKARDWRLSLFCHYVSGGLADADHDSEQVLETRVRLWLVPTQDGKLRVSDPGEGRIAELQRDVYGLMDEAKKYESAFQKLVSRADPETAKAASRDGISLLAGARLAIDLRSEGGDALAKLFDLDPKAVVRDAEEVLRQGESLSASLDAIKSALVDDDTRTLDLKNLLGDPRARLLLVLKLRPSPADLKARFDRFFTDVLPQAWFDVKGEKLVWKRSMFRDWQNHDTVEALRSRTYDSWTIQLRNLQMIFLSAAERSADPEVAELLRNVEALSLLRQETARVTEARAIQVEEQGTDLFVRLYFVEKDGHLVVRPERQAQMESLLARAEELRQEAEAQKKP